MAEELTRAELAELYELMQELHEYVADRQDADHDGERFIPNKAMRLTPEVERFCLRLERAL